ncbi:uncharacterized protein LOC133915363 isoform X2 [Phragmites australis]|uniref:uncharacterized protein LOC133915363 isoform X2 n=1 Tax=Phragmites australis TaxID=29695 RepID=UPI002D79136E|nr:uncharacterized protein LOC133915363 isoform X2 [Phragmites australis]XP_062214502.1 uncharacterized protein LOC133915363 isoform X2 [Phragmites australis]
MAQAARLNLRMQKEIQLLLNDPPHGVSLNLSEGIEGPEGTVYAKGVFILKIQIPERYPFQPPNVTFATPIYHPNIDNGGRICLDILNLPPKGAWQPSINIATVLTSIGLLLSEPNPDDGLMAEISREYKYNRQVFDINARLWTEKYASPAAVDASGWGSVDVAVLAQNTQMEDTESLGSLPNASNKHYEGSQRKMRLLGQKLSLKSERSEENATTGKQDLVVTHLTSRARSTYPTACLSDVSGKQNVTSENISVTAASGVVSKKEYQGNRKNSQLPGQRFSVTSEVPSKRSNGNGMLPNHLPTSASNAKDCAMQSSDDVLENSLARSIGGSSDSSCKLSEGNRKNIRTLGVKLSLKSVKPEKKSDDQKENIVPNHLPSQSSFNNLQKRPLDVSRKNFSEDTSLIQQNSSTEHQLSNTQLSNDECNQGRKKLRLLSKRLSLKSEPAETDRTCDKESRLPNCSQSGDRKLPNELPLSAPVLKSRTMVPGFADSQKDAHPYNCSVKQNTAATENLVVSDSEDSADECERPPRSRLSLMSRRLGGKLRN